MNNSTGFVHHKSCSYMMLLNCFGNPPWQKINGISKVHLTLSVSFNTQTKWACLKWAYVVCNYFFVFLLPPPPPPSFTHQIVIFCYGISLLKQFTGSCLNKAYMYIIRKIMATNLTRFNKKYKVLRQFKIWVVLNEVKPLYFNKALKPFWFYTEDMCVKRLFNYRNALDSKWGCYK